MAWIKQLSKATSWIALLFLGSATLFLVGSLIVRMFVFPPVSTKSHDVTTGKTVVIQLNILNGSGTNGIARQTMDFLRARGFDVVEIENYTDSSGKLFHDVKESFVIDRLGDTAAAAAVAASLGIPPSKISKGIDSSLYIHCSVVLGVDFSQLEPFR
jgi:hypothetical protein